METVYTQIPAQAEYMLVLRLLLAGLANLYHFDSEEIEDFKVALCEACFSQDNESSLDVSFFLEDSKMTIEVKRKSFYKKPLLGLDDPAGEGIGMLLMRNLTDSMEFRSNDEGTLIRLMKYQKSSVNSLKK